MTAVEWLQTELKKSIHFYRLIEDLESKSTILKDDIFAKAKEMEKQQIIDAHISGYDSSGESAEDYYKIIYDKTIKK